MSQLARGTGPPHRAVIADRIGYCPASAFGLRSAPQPSRKHERRGLADPPVGLAAYLLDHGDRDGQPAAAVVAALHRTSSATGELTRDEILDNVTLYWLTNTGSLRLVSIGNARAASSTPEAPRPGPAGFIGSGNPLAIGRHGIRAPLAWKSFVSAGLSYSPGADREIISATHCTLVHR